MYSPNYDSDYVSTAPKHVPADDGRSRRPLNFFEYVEVPPEVATTIAKAVTAIKTQPRNLVEALKKTPKEE